MYLRSVVGKFDAEENCLYDVLNAYNSNTRELLTSVLV